MTPEQIAAGERGQPEVRSVPVAVEPDYEVLVGSGLLEVVNSRVTERDLAVVSDSRVAPLYGERLVAALESGGERSVRLIRIAEGENSKSLAVLGEVLRQLAAAGIRRDGGVLAVGGGVVSDLAGFAAASYLRGVAFYTFPTSLLAMVDASVGGKTGVNLPEGKNLVGAFWQPKAVFADVATLATLSPRQFREGAVELFKHGLLADPYLLNALDDLDFRPDGDPRVLEEYVARSVRVKARVVGSDEREAGERAHLNLGHSLAHALEAASDHRLGHGDAVGYGLLFAALLGKGRGWHDFEDQARALLDWLEPAPLPCREFDELMPYLLRDKKNPRAGQRFVLLHERGTPLLVDDVDVVEQKHAWGRLLEALP